MSRSNSCPIRQKIRRVHARDLAAGHFVVWRYSQQNDSRRRRRRQRRGEADRTMPVVGNLTGDIRLQRARRALVRSGYVKILLFSCFSPCLLGNPICRALRVLRFCCQSKNRVSVQWMFSGHKVGMHGDGCDSNAPQRQIYACDEVPCTSGATCPVFCRTAKCMRDRSRRLMSRKS
jgi:hypothetical protein